jgi:trans-2-enoyl-CoA reductase
MLTSFQHLVPGDSVIMNAGDSAVSQCILQLAHAKHLRPVAVVARDIVCAGLDPAAAHSRWEQLQHHLVNCCGAAAVVEEAEVGSKLFQTLGLPAPKLAFNAVGGESSLRLAKTLAQGGTIVTYGGLSKQPLQLPTPKLIFGDIEARGFWLNTWTQEHGPATRAAAVDKVLSCWREGAFHFPLTHEVPFARGAGLPAAIAAATHPTRDEAGLLSKVVMRFDK